MLAPQSNASRTILDFSGVWDFRLKPDAPWQSIAVPASYNDQSADPEFRRHVVWRGIAAASPCHLCSKVSA